MTTTTTTKISTVAKLGQLADRTTLAVNVSYGDEPPRRIIFVGPSGGYGPVVMVTPLDNQTFVTDPSRFGAFGPEWVRRFFA